MKRSSEKLPAAAAVLVLVAVAIIAYFIFKGNAASASSASGIINAHEHIQSVEEAEKLVRVMDATNVSGTVLLGSPKQTIYFSGGFNGYDENNGELLKIKKAYPGRFYAFCAISPDDKDKLEKLKKCVAKGGDGVKLYSGHTLFYTKRLDDKDMYPVYEYIERKRLPLVWHVNPYHYQAEFEKVLQDFPGMTVICPHFCMSSSNLTKLRHLFSTYPNLYTDISFGYSPYMAAGLERVSKNTKGFKAIFRDYGDRILFGTDMVVTDYELKSEEWMINITGCYKAMLEKGKYRCFLINKTLNGLGINESSLDKVYRRNFEGVMGKVMR